MTAGPPGSGFDQWNVNTSGSGSFASLYPSQGDGTGEFGDADRTWGSGEFEDFAVNDVLTVNDVDFRPLMSNRPPMVNSSFLVQYWAPLMYLIELLRSLSWIVLVVFTTIEILRKPKWYCICVKQSQYQGNIYQQGL